MKKVTSASLLPRTRKLLGASELNSFPLSLDGSLKNSRSWGTAGGESKEQTLGGLISSGHAPGFTKMMTACLQALGRGDFRKGLKEFCPSLQTVSFRLQKVMKYSREKKISASLLQRYGE